MTSAPAIAFELRPARALGLTAAGVLVLATVAVGLSGLTVAVKVLLCVALCGGGAWRLWRYWHPRWRRASLQGGEWTLTDGVGHTAAARVLHHAAFGSAVQLDLAVGTRRCSHLLLPGNSDADTRRRLRLLLAATAPSARGDAAA